jgi:transcriptional regulator with XRE-family HTH domain
VGIKSRWKATQLPKKLRQIRKALGLSQGGMLRRLGIENEFYRQNISAYERGEVQPPLPIIILYAEVAGVCSDVLIDDRLQLPRKLPSTPEHARATKQKS